MQFLGYDAGLLRLPLVEMEEKNAILLKEELLKLGVIK
jgi:hypothetical protein